MLAMVIHSPVIVERPCWPSRNAAFPSGLEEHLQQVVEEQPAAFGRAQLLAPGLEQALGLGLVQGAGDLLQRLAGTLGVPGARHAIDQPQGVHQEIERQLVCVQRLAAGQIGFVRIQVVLGQAGLPVALHLAIGVGQLAVGTGTQAEKVAVLPVIEVMAGAVAALGIGRNLVLGVAAGGLPKTRMYCWRNVLVYPKLLKMEWPLLMCLKSRELMFQQAMLNTPGA